MPLPGVWIEPMLRPSEVGVNNLFVSSVTRPMATAARRNRRLRSGSSWVAAANASAELPPLLVSSRTSAVHSLGC